MRKNSLIPVFLVYFLDNFSLIIVLPLFSTLILSHESYFLPQQVNMIMRNMLFGVLTGAFPLGVFLGAPLIGNAADFWGRKKAFFLALLGIIIGNLLTTCALLISSYYFLLISRLFTGLFSSNLALCFASVSDLSPTAKIRAKNFGLLSAIGGLSWVLAILAGWLLTDRQIDETFNPTTPFLIAAAVALFNLIIMAFLYQETAPENKAEFRFIKGIDNVLNVFHAVKIRRLVGVLLFFMIGWLINLQWYGGFAIEKFNIDRHQLIAGLAILGAFWILGSALFNRYCINSFLLPKIPFWGLLFLSILFILTGQADRYLPFSIVNSFSACIAPIVLSNLLNLISITGSEFIQGKIMGIGLSVIAAAQFLAPMLGAVFLIGGFGYFYFYISIPVLAAFVLLYSEMDLLKNQKGR